MEENKKKGLKKHYLKKDSKKFGFEIWVVDGNYIRKNMDKEFTNFGQNYRFKFIPKKELWLDKEYSKKTKEKDFYIKTMIRLDNFLSNGMDYNKAVKIVEIMEKRERAKSKYLKKFFKFKSKKKVIEKIHLSLIKKYSFGNLKTWIVDGELVRGLYFLDFTQGGHDFVYNFVPKNEIWIDNDIGLNERKFIFLHEIYERNLMKKGMKYNLAHQKSSLIENYARKNSKKVDGLILKEIKKS